MKFRKCLCKFSNKQIFKLFTIFGFRFQLLRIPPTFADSTNILRNPLTIEESRTTSYICLLRNPQQIKYADKFYVTSICTRNPRKSFKWNPLTFWNMFKYLSLKSRNMQTQNCVPIQCTVWPRYVNNYNFDKSIYYNCNIIDYFLFLLSAGPTVDFKNLLMRYYSICQLFFEGQKMNYFTKQMCVLIIYGAMQVVIFDTLKKCSSDTYSQKIRKKYSSFSFPPPPPPTSRQFQLISVTSDFTMLSIKTKYVCRGLISLYVNFHKNRTMWSTNLHVKNSRWGRGKENEPKIFIEF